MRMISRAALMSVLSLLVIGVAVADPIEVSFSRGGQLITGLQVAAFDDSGAVMHRFAPNPAGTYVVNATVGQKVSFQVSQPLTGMTFQTEGIMTDGPVNIDIPVPNTTQQVSNDTCDTAIPIVVGQTAGTTTGATTDTGTPSCGTATVTSPGVWYSFVGTGNTMVTSTCENSSQGSANYDTKISVFCLDCVAPICVGGNDDELGCSFHSTVVFDTEAGANYFVMVHGFGGATGNFVLDLIDTGVGSTNPVACLPPEPEGACCNCNAPPFNCWDGLTATECDARGGQYYGDDTVCVDVQAVRYESMPGLAFGGSAGQPTSISDTITVPDSFPILDVNVELQISHTWIGDMEITISHGAASTMLWNNACGSTVNLNSTFDDTGTEVYCSAIAAGPADQVFIPSDIFDVGTVLFEGMDALGDWTLNIVDTWPSLDDGVLNAWAVVFEQGSDPLCPDQNNGTCFKCDGTGPGGDDDDDDYSGGGGDVSNLDLEAVGADDQAGYGAFDLNSHAGDSTRGARDEASQTRKLNKR